MVWRQRSRISTVEIKITTFELLTYIRILKISQTDEITNIQIFRRMETRRKLLCAVKSRKRQYV